jgi:hypothetical protein
MGRSCGKCRAAKIGKNKVGAGHRNRQRENWMKEDSMVQTRSRVQQDSGEEQPEKPVRIEYTHTIEKTRNGEHSHNNRVTQTTIENTHRTIEYTHTIDYTNTKIENTYTTI